MPWGGGCGTIKNTAVLSERDERDGGRSAVRKDRGISREEEPVLLLDKGKQGIFHLIFGRTGVVRCCIRQ